MECNKTFISIKQLEQQDLSADKICSILFQLYDELTIYEDAIKVDDIKIFRSHMNTLLDRILGLYKNNEEELSKLVLYKRIEDKEKNIENYQNKINELEDDINKLDELNKVLYEKTKDYDNLKKQYDILNEENKELESKVLELDHIDLKELQDRNNKLSLYIENKQKDYDQLNKDYKVLTDHNIELDEIYHKLYSEYQVCQHKNDKLKQLIEENEVLLSKNKELKELQNKINELTHINEQLTTDIKDIEHLLGIQYNEDYHHNIEQLNHLYTAVKDSLEDYPLKHIEELDLYTYMDYIHQYISDTKETIETHYNKTKNIYIIISKENKTSRKE